MTSTTSSLGSLLGMRHALEPDHLAAVSTLVTGERSSRKAAWLGACWGVGHTATLFVAGTGLVVLRAEMPASADVAFEDGVVFLLIGFGVRAVIQAFPDQATHQWPVRPPPHGTGISRRARRIRAAAAAGWRGARSCRAAGP